MSHDLMLSIAYQSLGDILRKMSELSITKTSSELSEYIHNALFFHAQLEEEFRGLIGEKQVLKQRLYELTKDPRERECHGVEDFSQYEKMRDAGRTPQEVGLAARSHGLEAIKIIKIMRAVFSMSLIDAKKMVDELET
jgi:hypothetical protein